MPRQLPGYLDRCAALDKAGYIGVPQTMKIDHAARPIDHRQE
ncbi:MAG: hypothetical protein WEC36_15815 [Phycisphaeraceae bacterium]